MSGEDDLPRTERVSSMLKDFVRNRFYYLILLPAFVVIVFLTAYPVVQVFANSFSTYNYLNNVRVAVGLKNYVHIIEDNLFQISFLNTVIFSLVATAAEVCLGLFLALLFYGLFPGKRMAMILVVFPMMVSTMVVCAVWRTLFQFDIGLFNYVLKAIGLRPLGWLSDPHIALFSVIVVDIWQWTPFAFIVLQAGLLSVRREVFEAAGIDGAGYIATVFRITIPLLWSQILLVVLLRTIDTFRVFAKVFALTGGGPGNSTETLSFYIYREGFVYFNLGRASTASVYVLIAIALIAFVYIRQILKGDTA
jgi:multiple sugar transport system permease protein